MFWLDSKAFWRKVKTCVWNVLWGGYIHIPKSIQGGIKPECCLYAHTLKFSLSILFLKVWLWLIIQYSGGNWAAGKPHTSNSSQSLTHYSKNSLGCFLQLRQPNWFSSILYGVFHISNRPTMRGKLILWEEELKLCCFCWIGEMVETFQSPGRNAFDLDNQKLWIFRYYPQKKKASNPALLFVFVLCPFEEKRSQKMHT